MGKKTIKDIIQDIYFREMKLGNINGAAVAAEIDGKIGDDNGRLQSSTLVDENVGGTNSDSTIHNRVSKVPKSNM